MSRYDIATIRSRIIDFEIARQNEAVLPNSPMPDHVYLAHEFAKELPHCRLSQDFVNVWEVIDGEIYWDDGAEPSDFWEEFRDDYHFPFLKDWSTMSELEYSSPSGGISVSIRFAELISDITFKEVRTFPYAHPEFEKHVDQFLYSIAVEHQTSPRALGRFDHMKRSIAIHASQSSFGEKSIAASLAELFARRHTVFRFAPEVTAQTESGSIAPYFLNDEFEQLLASIEGHDESNFDTERLTEWGCRAKLEYETHNVTATVLFDDPTATCTCTRTTRCSVVTTKQAVARVLSNWSLPIPVHRHRNTALYAADCRQILRALDESPKFLFADPPFNIGHGYDGYDDSLSDDDYCQFTKEWIHAAEDCLADDGVMAVHVPDSVVPLVLESSRLTRIAWIIWHYRFGQCGRTNWINSKAHCLVFAKNPSRYTWNPDDVLVSSDRATTYKDKRTLQSATPGQRVPFDVWGIPSDGPNWGRVQGNNAERRPGHPNQLPEVYLERLIRAYTDPGDLALDPFVGSGTTVVVAEALGRRSIGIDISLSNIDSAYERVQNGAVRNQLCDRTRKTPKSG